MDYQQIYTDLRTAKMSFTEFMDFLATVYELGIEKASVTIAPVEIHDYFAAAPLGEQFEYRACQ